MFSLSANFRQEFPGGKFTSANSRRKIFVGKFLSANFHRPIPVGKYDTIGTNNFVFCIVKSTPVGAQFIGFDEKT